MQIRHGIVLALLLSGLLLCLFPAAVRADEEFRFTEGKHKQGELKYVDGLPVLLVQGTPEEIGEQMGTLVGQVVKPMHGLPKEILRQHGLGALWPVIVATSRRLVTRAPKEYQREIEAGAKAAVGVDSDVLYVANAMIELRRLGGCSALLVEPARSATGEMLFGRNFDFDPMGVLHKYSLVIVCRPNDKHAFVSVAFPGLTGVVSGMNDEGLALATLDVYSSRDGSSMFSADGVPLSLTYRRVLEECKNVEEAGKLLAAAKHTTWMNLAVCDRERAVIFEITPKQVVVRNADRNLLACTNHFRTEELSTGQGCGRYQRLERYQKLEKVSLKDVAGALHAVNQGHWTLQSMVFEPKSLRLHLAIGRGPVSARPLMSLDLQEWLRPKE